MTTRIITVRSRNGTTDGASVFAFLAKELAGAPPQLIVVFASTKCPLEELMAHATRTFPGVTAVGSSTAGEFNEKSEGKGQFVAWVLAGDDVRAVAGIGRGLKANPERAVAAALPKTPDDAERPFRTAILLLDPLSGNGEETALLASTLLGPTVRLAGGAAGDDLEFSRANVALGPLIANDAIVIVSLSSRKPLGIGVQHGHTPISKPMTVTSAEGSVVKELDGKPAFEVWKDAVRETAKRRGLDIDAVPTKEMGGHLLRYELGLISGANEYKIRAPLSAAADGSLTFACGLPTGAVVRVTESIEEAQIASARTAAERAKHGLGTNQIAGALVFDCICRNLILGSRFADAVKQIHAALGNAPLAGFETYGEIAMDLGQSSGFHNTTTVVLAFPA